MKSVVKILLFMVLIIVMCGCTIDSGIKKNEVSVSISSGDVIGRDIFAMDTYMEIKIFGETSDQLLDKSENEIKRLAGLFDVTNPDSDIGRINRLSGGRIKVDPSTQQLITKSLEISKETDGALDISIYPVVREWGFTTGKYKIPAKTRIDELLKKVDYKTIDVLPNGVKIPKDSAIDPGSVAKGYTGDRICELLKNSGVTSAIINLGGNVQTIGKKTDGSMWNVGIKDPSDSSKNVCTVQIYDKAVVTSGNYERFFEGSDGKKYWHIIDPEDGYPADNGIISATVIGDNGTLCDGLSTALFVMGTEKAISFCEEHAELEMILVTEDMKIFITDGLEKAVTVNDGYNYSFIKRKR